MRGASAGWAAADSCLRARPSAVRCMNAALALAHRLTPRASTAVVAGKPARYAPTSRVRFINGLPEVTGLLYHNPLVSILYLIWLNHLCFANT